MTDTVLTFRAQSRLVQTLDLIVETTGKSHQHHLNQALLQYVRTEWAHIQAISEATAGEDASNVTSLEAILAKWQARINR